MRNGSGGSFEASRSRRFKKTGLFETFDV